MPASHSVRERYVYDHPGRLLEQWHQIDAADSVLIVSNEYNELGQLVKKDLHNTQAVPRQSIDYRYNIRGWLTRVNNADVNTNIDEGPRDYFGMELGYNNDLGIGSTEPQYNGNISGLKWSANLGLAMPEDINQRGYVFRYDPMNRLKDATHKERINAWDTSVSFHEDNLSFDLNGNILSLNRKGKDGIPMDELDYDYGSDSLQSNRLLSVTDTGNDNEGFKELNSSGDDYVYDANGNLLWDKNKGGKELLTNGSFDNSSANWTLGGATARLSFANGALQVNASTTSSATLTQSGMVSPHQQYVVIVDMVKTSSAGSIQVNVGGTNTSLSSSGLKIFTVAANFGSDLKVTASGGFAGHVNLVSLKGIVVISYNYLNLPGVVTSGSEQLRYTYDATGRKLSQGKSESLLTGKKTHYSGEYIYENDTLQFIQHAEGRIIPETDSSFTYQYHLKDHLGNVRMTFTTKQDVDQYKATMEDSHITEERADFPNYDSVTTSGVSMYNKTDESGATRSVVLNGAPNKQVGLAKSLKVIPGDTIDLEVYAKYFTPTSPTENVGTFIASAVTGAFGLSTGSVGPEYSAYQSLNGMFNTGWVLDADDWDDVSAPKAFLNYILFDEDFIPYDMGADQINVNAGVTQSNPNPDHDTLSLQAVARKPGYVYIYFSNEDDDIIEVYFDDLNIRHKHSPVVQADDYYPFGLTFNSYQKESSMPNQYLYNSKELQDELNLGWYDYFARQYDPSLGRFLSVDPAADLMRRHGVYNYAYDNPVLFTDPDGMVPEDSNDCGSNINCQERRKEKFDAWLKQMEEEGKVTNGGGEGNDEEAQQGGPGDPFEWNLKFTFGPQVGLRLGDLFDLDIRLWTFGEISTKDDIRSAEFNDGKITSEHSFAFKLFGQGFGKGMEHKLGYKGGHNAFTHSDFRWLTTRFGTTTKTDVLGNVVEKEHDSTVFGISPIFFSIELTKDFK